MIDSKLYKVLSGICLKLLGERGSRLRLKSVGQETPGIVPTGVFYFQARIKEFEYEEVYLYFGINCCPC